MKTPRELLLARHDSIRPRLDAVRRAVVAEHVGPEPVGQATAGLSFLARLWSELFWPSRRVWAGLAVAWLAILGLNLAGGGDSQQAGRAAVVRTSAEVRQLRAVAHEQAQWRAELLELEPSPRTVQRGSATSGPRSERSPKGGAKSA